MNVDTSALDPADVQEYRGYFKLVYNRETTLSHDELVSLVLSTEEEMEPKDWAEAMLNAEENDDRSSDTGSDDVDETALLTSSAYEYASKWDDQFITDLETNAKAALEGKRGAAVLMQDLVRMHGEDVILNNWPVPETKAGDGNRQTHKYHKSVKDQATGETKVGNNNGDWYYDLFDASKPGRELQVRVTSWKGAKAGESGKHILPRHKAMAGSEIKLVSEKSKLDSERTTKKNAIVRAVKIVFTMHRLNTETDMKVELITQDDGTPIDSPKLFWCSNKKDHKTFVIKTIGQLLAFNIDKAKALGGSYENVIGTTGRGKKAAAGTVTIPTIDKMDLFDQVTAEYAAFWEKLAGDTKATNQFLVSLNGAESDDKLLSLYNIQISIDSYLSKPVFAKRISNLLTGTTDKREALKQAFANGPSGKVA